MQRGGFDIISLKNSDFKYTGSADRILWTKNVFPIGEYIAKAIMNIPWKTYTFVGETTLWVQTDQNNNNNNRGFQLSQGKETFERRTVPVRASYPEDNPGYYFFGGSVYELMNTLYRNDHDVPDLHSYVDPTGDMDVLVNYPKFRFLKNQDPMDYAAYFFETLPAKNNTNKKVAEPLESRGCHKERIGNYMPNNQISKQNVVRDGRRYSEFIEHFTDWILDELAEQILSLKKGTLFDSLFGNTIPFNIENDAEGANADTVICVDNLKIARSFLPSMNLIKIQLIAKFTGMTKSDHICELLIRMNDMPEGMETLTSLTKNPKDEYHILKGVPMSNFKELISGNVNSIKNRKIAYAVPNSRHKFYNHVQRMLYIHDFLERKVNTHKEKNKAKITLPDSEYYTTAAAMGQFAMMILEEYTNSELYKYDYKFMKSMDWSNEVNPKKKNIHTIGKKILQKLIGVYPSFLFYRNFGLLFSYAQIHIYNKDPKYPGISSVIENFIESPALETKRQQAKQEKVQYLYAPYYTITDIFEIFRILGVFDLHNIKN